MTSIEYRRLWDAAEQDPNSADVMADYWEERGEPITSTHYRRLAAILRAAKFKIGQSVQFRNGLQPFKVVEVLVGTAATAYYTIQDLSKKRYSVSEADLKQPRRQTSYKRRRLY